MRLLVKAWRELPHSVGNMGPSGLVLRLLILDASSRGEKHEQVPKHWTHIQRMTERMRLPLVIWLRSKGLLKPFVWAVTQMRLTKVDSIYHGYCPTIYTREAWSLVGGGDDVRVSGDVELIKRLEQLKEVQPELGLEEYFAFELGQKCRLHGGNASQTLLEERKVGFENRVQEIQSWKRQEQFRLSPKTATWRSLLQIES